MVNLFLCFQKINIMRRIIAIVALCAAFAAQGQTTYKETFKEANAPRHWSMGLVGGVMGHFDRATRGAMGATLIIGGVYADYVGWGSGLANDVRVGSWTSPTCDAFHFGYQVPLNKHWRVIPMAGYFRVGYTNTDGHHYTVTSSGVSNVESRTDVANGFDYGVAAVYHIPMPAEFPIAFNLQLTVTRHALYAGFSLNAN